MKCHPFEFRIACLSLPILSFFFGLAPRFSLPLPFFLLFSFGGRVQSSRSLLHPATTVLLYVSSFPPPSPSPHVLNAPHCLSRLHLSIFVRFLRWLEKIMSLDLPMAPRAGSPAGLALSIEKGPASPFLCTLRATTAGCCHLR
ncbi:hypothetical protein BJX64DRAFT_172787 [Aspergillus heterothallicus]